MTIEQQNVAIAEACGWHGIKTGFEGTALGPIGMFGPTRGYQHIPNYVNDLNRMHDAEKVLLDDKSDSYARFDLYLHHLENRVCADRKLDIDEDEWNAHIAFATAAQRAEAFLRTIGKWIDKTEEF